MDNGTPKAWANLIEDYSLKDNQNLSKLYPNNACNSEVMERCNTQDNHSNLLIQDHCLIKKTSIIFIYIYIK